MTVTSLGYQEAVSIKRRKLTNIGISVIKISRSDHHVIFIMEMPKPGKTVFIMIQSPVHETQVWVKKLRSGDSLMCRWTEIIGSSNGLSPARSPTITQYPCILVRTNVFENAVCKMSAILFKPHCVKHDDCTHQYRFTSPVNKHSRLQTPITEHCRWKESSYIMDRI